jgi:hypothetical protein
VNPVFSQHHVIADDEHPQPLDRDSDFAGWKGGDTAGEKTLSYEKTKKPT